jgi:hypothetical protein
MLEQLGIDPNMGLLEAYESVIAPSQVNQRRQAVEGDISMLKDLGGELIQAQRDADPLAESLRQKVMTGSGELADRMQDELDGEFVNTLREEMDGEDIQQLRADLEGGDVQARREEVDGGDVARLRGEMDGADIQRLRSEIDGGDVAGLREEMTGGLVGQLQDEYNAGGGLTAQERRDLDQQVLGMAQERGAVGQNATDFNRMRERLTGDRMVRQQRLQNLMGAKQQALQNYAGLRQQAQDNYSRGRQQALENYSGARQQALQNYGVTKQQAFQNYSGARQQALQNFMTGRQQGISNYASALQNTAGAYQLGAQDPLMALTGRASRVPGDVAGQFNTAGFALDSSPALFNPESPYAGALAASNQQNIMDARVATASNRANMMSGLFSGLGAFGGGLFQGRFGG